MNRADVTELHTFAEEKFENATTQRDIADSLT